MKAIYANEERMERGFHLIHKSVSRALSNTNLIMEYSKISQITDVADEVNLDQLIESIVEEQSEVFKEQKVKVRLNLRGQGVRIKGHETNFHTVLNNLILNARDALIDPMNQNKEGHRIDGPLPDEFLIEIMSETVNSTGRGAPPEHPFYTVQIKDNGVGIPEKNLSRIYEAFFSTKPESGTGLGLGFAQKIVSVYGGTIEVESEVGSGRRSGGTTFTVTFPVTL